MKLDELKPAEGSKTKSQRLGRGIAGKGGKTAGRGTKGQRSRGRGKVAVGFEGGQYPLHRRTPKLPGFNNPFRVEYQGINLSQLEESSGSEVSPESLVEAGLVRKGELVKILGNGELKKSLVVKAHAFSKSAKKAIEAAGGSVEELAKPFKVRPASKGSSNTNR